MISDLVMLWQDKRVNTEQYLPSTNWSDQQIRVYWRTLAWTSQILSRKLNDRMTTKNYQETMILTKTRKRLHMFHHPDSRSWERMSNEGLSVAKYKSLVATFNHPPEWDKDIFVRVTDSAVNIISSLERTACHNHYLMNTLQLSTDIHSSSPHSWLPLSLTLL